MSKRSGHRPTAYGCQYWTGDRSPLDRGTCPLCGPPQPRETPYGLSPDSLAEQCPECGGSGGWVLGLDPIECNTCRGAGTVVYVEPDNTGLLGLLALLAVGVLFFGVWFVTSYADELSSLVGG